MTSTRTSMKATKTELLATARNLGCPGSLSRMTMDDLAGAIAKRRAYLATPAADIPKSKPAPRNDRFQGGRQGTTYTCRSCGKLTRETGRDESGVDLCAACLDEAEWENAHSDNNHDAEPDAACPICQQAAAAAEQTIALEAPAASAKVTASAKAAAAYRARFGIWPAEAAGLRYTGQARSTKTLTSVYNGAEAGLDTAGGPWTVLCETHSMTLAVATLTQALAFSAAPEQWCETCAG